MRKITILEVFDRLEDRFVPVRQAINQGLFNSRTYLFFDPVEQQHYSISEAAKLGLFKCAIEEHQPSALLASSSTNSSSGGESTALIIEKVKLTQSVYLLSARDPSNKNKIVPIRDAIDQGIVDVKARVYIDAKGNQIGLDDAIDAGLVKVKIARETTEKIKETLTEQRAEQASPFLPAKFQKDESVRVGLVKRIETSSQTDLDNDDDDDSQTSSSERSNVVKEVNGLLVFDRVKAVSVNKRLKKYQNENDLDDKPVAGYISENDTKKLSSSSTASGGRNEFNFQEALSQNMIILPDSISTSLGHNVKYVLDLANDRKVTLDEACQLGIVNLKQRRYQDTRGNKTLSLFEALSKNYIVMKDELTNNYEDSDSEESVRSRRKLRAEDIATVFNPNTGEQCELDKAVELGLFDLERLVYIDQSVRASKQPSNDHQHHRVVSLDEACDKGLVILRSGHDSPSRSSNRIEQDYKFLRIQGVINPATGEKLTLSEAIATGFLDYLECEVHDPVSGRTLSLLDAYDKGFLVTVEESNVGVGASSPLSSPVHRNINDPSSPSKIQINTKVESQPAQATNVTSAYHEPVESVGSAADKTKSLPSNKMIKSKSFHHTTVLDNEPTVDQAPNDANKQQTFRSSRDNTVKSNANQDDEVKRADDEQPNGKLRSMSSFDLKSLDRVSSQQRKRNSSLIAKLRVKLSGKQKFRSNVLNDELILKSARVIDTKQGNKLTLEEAGERGGLIVADNKIRDRRVDRLLTVTEAIEKSVLKFFHPINNFEFKYGQSCYIFGDNYLFLVNFVIDPNDKNKKVGLKNAFNRSILDKENSVYYVKKGPPLPLIDAIEKGLISCEIIDINLLSGVLNEIYVRNEAKRRRQQRTESLTQGQEVERLPPRYEPNRSYLEHSEHSKSEQEPKEATSSKEKRSNRLSGSTASNEQTIKEAEETVNDLKENDDAFEKPKSLATSSPKNQYQVPKQALIDAGYNFSDSKSYYLNQVYDPESKEWLDMSTATKLGIYDTKTSQYVNPVNGESLRLAMAIRKQKVKLIEQVNSSSRPTTPKSSVRSQANLNDTAISSIRESTNKSNDSVVSSLSPPAESYETFKKDIDGKLEKQAKKPLMASDLMLNEANKNPSDEFTAVETANTKAVKSPTPPTGSPPKIVLTRADTNNNIVDSDDKKKSIRKSKTFPAPETTTANTNFNLPKALYLKKAQNGKYIKFEQAIKKKWYNPSTGLISDPFASRASISINQAFKQGILKLADQRTIVDPVIGNVYFIESVLDYNTKFRLTLLEATEAQLVDRNKCIYLKNDDAAKWFSLKEAIKSNLVVGKCYEAAEIRRILDDFVRKMSNQEAEDSADPPALANLASNMRNMFKESRISHKSIEEDLDDNSSDDNADRKSIKALENYNEFFVYDPETEHYISLGEAFFKGILLNEPIRVRDPSSGNYILLKDAVVKGLLSTVRSTNRVDFKNRASFLTHNRVTYIIDWINETPHSTSHRYSLQEGMRRGLFSNGHYKRAVGSKVEQLKLDDAIALGYVVGKRVDLDNLEARFKSSVNFPDKPPKPTRGIFLSENDDEEEAGYERIPTRDPSVHSFNTETDSGLDKPTKQSKRAENIKSLSSNDIRGRAASDYSRNTLKSSQTVETLDDMLYSGGKSNNRIQDMGIQSVMDPDQQKYVELDEAIRKNLFNPLTRMYMAHDDQAISLVEAVDQQLIKMKQSKLTTSIALVINDSKRKFSSVVNIRYIVDSFTDDIVPVYQAVSRNLIKLDSANPGASSLVDSTGKVLSLEEAYKTGLALTTDDLDDNPRGLVLKIHLIKKSDTGKVMSLKTALVKSWLSVDRRVYIDKQNQNSEYKFSQAVDMDLIVMRVDKSSAESGPSDLTTNQKLAMNGSRSKLVVASSASRDSSRNRRAI